MKVFVILIVVGVGLGAWFLSSSPSSLPLPGFSTPSPVPLKRDIIPVTYNNITYQVGWMKVNPAEMKLFPNFKEKLIAKDALEKNMCQMLVSGGFYTTDDKPTGLFIHEGGMVREQNTSTLLNGVLAITFDEKPTIGKSYARGSTRIGLQAGPLLIQKGQEASLSLQNDEPARRIAVATLPDGALVFLVFYSQESHFAGPYLKDLPKIVGLVAKQLNLSIVDAINLDGGTASAFLTQDISLSEASPIGSYFCVR